MTIAQSNANSHVIVHADDTDIFVLLLHYYDKLKLKSKMYMESPRLDPQTIDIEATVNKM